MLVLTVCVTVLKTVVMDGHVVARKDTGAQLAVITHMKDTHAR